MTQVDFELLTRVEIRPSATKNTFDLALVGVEKNEKVVGTALAYFRAIEQAQKLAKQHGCAVLNTTPTTWGRH